MVSGCVGQPLNLSPPALLNFLSLAWAPTSSGLNSRRLLATFRIRINRVRLGNFGDCEPVKGIHGLHEFRLHLGPGYRVYFGKINHTVVVLLCGGDKRSDDPHVFLLALRDIAEAKGGMSWLSDESDLNRENLYRTLSLKGNPRFFNLLAVLDAVGLEFSIKITNDKPRNAF